MLPAVNIEDLAGDSGGGEEVEGGTGEVVEGGALGEEEGAGFFRGVGRREDGAGGNGVDADGRGEFDGGR